LTKQIIKPNKSLNKFVDSDFLNSSALARESIHISEVATEYFKRERMNNKSHP